MLGDSWVDQLFKMGCSFSVKGNVVEPEIQRVSYDQQKVETLDQQRLKYEHASQFLIEVVDDKLRGR